MTITKAAAITEARRLVSKPHRLSHSDYVVYAPYYSNKPRGPRTELRANSYAQALSIRTATIAYVALALMGVSGIDIVLQSGQSLNALIADGIAQAAQRLSPDEQAAADAATEAYFERINA
jgi:hypothetical protein